MKSKNRTQKNEHCRLLGALYMFENQWRSNFRKQDEIEPKEDQYPTVDITGDKSKVDAVKNAIS